MFLFLIFCTIQTGCSKANVTEKNYKNFDIPNKIIFYDKGKKTTINKDNNLFTQVLELTDKRFDKEVEVYLSAIDKKDIAQMEEDELILEFVYSSIVETQYTIQQKSVITKYKRLIMPLSGKQNTYMWFDRGDGSASGPFYTLSVRDDLIKILK